MHISQAFRLMAMLVVSTLCVASAPHAESTQNVQFEKLKQMAGDWTISGLDGKVSATANFAVTSGGSVVIETTFAGQENQMITIYTRDGKRLIATHYCYKDNQPRFISQPGKSPDHIKFDFLEVFRGAQSPPSFYLRDLELSFLDDGRVREDRQFYNGDAPAFSAVLIFTRRS